ncbi:hypothetical protein M8C21_009416 [Ambrosia artemisiifolia]|uniref:Uncharacterized protein n=1 Tax=Ambrosia artemisiifolia TaxID=4212 RepID=A0AAD5CE27_AMBAR|nr:hypothetical protein M8C21_009416 [Ambrosia artemisiifolia]
MANRLPNIIQNRFSILTSLHHNSSISCSTIINSCTQLSRTLKRSKNLRLSRRLVLGIGVSSWAQFMNMSTTNSIIASARTKGAVDHILENVEWPEQFPFKDEDFQRFDESSDLVFYESPRFVTHIDDPAIAALTKYYKEVFPPSNSPGVALLDMCSSWVSHFPAGYKQERIAGMGLNEEELKANKVLTEYVVQDLNTNPKLPFEDNSFDVITNVAISIWTSTGDADHVMIVGAYFHYAGGFEPPQAVDISPNPGRSDPMYIVHSRKLATA